MPSAESPTEKPNRPFGSSSGVSVAWWRQPSSTASKTYTDPVSSPGVASFAAPTTAVVPSPETATDQPKTSVSLPRRVVVFV